MKHPVLLAVSLVALAGCGSSEPQVQVPFPQGEAEQALHCVYVLNIQQLRFSETARDILPDSFAETVSNEQQERVAPAIQASIAASLRTGAMPMSDILDTQKIEAGIRSTLAPFGTDAREFARHADTCLNLYGVAAG